MADGTSKPIVAVAVGEKVATTDPDTGQPGAQAVTALHRNQDLDLTDVTISSTTAGTGAAAGSTGAAAGSTVAAAGSTGAAAGGTAVRSFTGRQTMADLTVDTTHTYYVIVGTTPVLVHNCGEDFYRTMSQEHYDILESTGKLSATRETFISPTRAFSEAYDGVLARITVRDGTTQRLAEIGVRDNSSLASRVLSSMPLVGRGWRNTNAFFKGEGSQINIGLGGGNALDLFNGAITGFERLK
jgi:hypothetical protein